MFVGKISLLLGNRKGFHVPVSPCDKRADRADGTMSAGQGAGRSCSGHRLEGLQMTRSTAVTRGLEKRPRHELQTQRVHRRKAMRNLV